MAVKDIPKLPSDHMPRMQKWAVYDTKDNCWLGDKNGPKTFEDQLSPKNDGTWMDGEVLCRMAAQMVAMQIGHDPTRYRCRPFNETGCVKKDDVPTRMGAEEALKRMEEGRLG